MPSRPSPIDELRTIERVMAAMRPRIGAMDRDGIRRLLVSELEQSGVMLPPPILDFYLAELIARPGATASARRSFIQAARFAGGLARFASAAMSQRPLPVLDNSGARVIATDPRKLAEVILDSDAQAVLAVGESDLISVWLERAESHVVHGRGHDSTDETLNRYVDTIVVWRGERPLGVLGGQAREAYGQIMTDAEDASVVPVIMAFRRRSADGLWSLELGLPANTVGAERD